VRCRRVSRALGRFLAKAANFAFAWSRLLPANSRRSICWPSRVKRVHGRLVIGWGIGEHLKMVLSIIDRQQER
jgi:hypothetical protein